MEVSVLLALALVVVVTYLLVSGRRGRSAPGPLGLPLVGYLPFITSKPHVKLMELGKIYGPIISLNLGLVRVVVLNDFSLMKKAFAKDAFMGRPPGSPFQLSKENIESGAFNGMAWKEQRRLSLHLLRDVGFGKSQAEEHIKEEIRDLLDRFEKSNGKPIAAPELLAPSVSNNISSLVFGRRMPFDDPNRIMLDEVLKNTSKYAGQVAWQFFYPTLGKVFNFLRLSASRELTKYLNIFKQFTWKEITEHEKTLDPNIIRDFIDGYLLEIAKRPNDPAFKKPVLQDLVGGFFGAGSETVKSTLDWLLLTMANYRDVQKKVQNEIDDVIGQERSPTGSDRLKTPYTEAVIMEVMRWITILPINPPRYTLEDTELNGYSIPKNTTILANLWGVHHDPDLWGNDTEVYRPERFLTEDGKTVKKIEHLVGFSIGKRSCPGENFARVEVFMYFASILQKFDILLPEGQNADFDGILGISLQPKRQPLRFVKRQ